MAKFDLRLQKIEAVHSAKKSSDNAGTATVQPSMENVIDRKGGVDGEKAG